MPGFNSIKIGDGASLQHSITLEEVKNFASLTGDTNALHLDEEFAGKTKFGKCVVHGMLVASFISTMIGTVFPGKGALYLGQDLKFKKPVFVNDIIQVNVKVIQKVDSSQMIELKTTVTNQHSEIVISGSARVTWVK